MTDASNMEISRYLKTGNASSDERTSMLAEEIIRVFRESITPKNVFAIYECEACSQTVTLGGMTVSSVNLAKHLKNCRRAVLLAATLGAGADTLIRKYSVQDMEKTLIAQNVSTAMIEAYLDEIEKDLLKSRELTGLHPVTRFSPGYGDFNITCQKEILKLLNASRIGLALTDGFMLLPSKSVTAVIGFTEEQKKAAPKCACCTDKNCGYREEIQ